MNRSPRIDTVKGLLLLVLAIAGLGILCGSPLFAQPYLRVNDVLVQWPAIRFTFNARCDNKWVYGIDTAQIVIRENGKIVQKTGYWCPPEAELCPLNAALVLDASTSMAGPKNLATIAAGTHFIDLMDDAKDQSAVIWFNESVTIRQNFTTDRVALKEAIAELPFDGMTAVWDGAYVGIEQVVTTNLPISCRAVIVLTDGNDNSSIRSLSSVISYALAEQVRVFVIGFGTDVNDEGLNLLATITGGKYYQTSDEIYLKDIFERVFIDIIRLQNCELEYRSTCPDGGQRTIDIEISNFCGYRATQRVVFTAPLDSGSFLQLPIGVQGGLVEENAIIVVPVELETNTGGEDFPPGSFHVRYDTVSLRFLRLKTDSGAVLTNAGAVAKDSVGTVIVSWSATLPPLDAGNLAYLVFESKRTDTVRCVPVALDSFRFERGCLLPKPHKDDVCVLPKLPRLTCAATIPDEWVQTATLDELLFAPFDVQMSVMNIGSKAANRPRYRIAYDTTCFRLVTPSQPFQQSALQILEGGMTDSVRWIVEMINVPPGDTATFCIIASFDNGPDLVCCAQLAIRRPDKGVLCALKIPAIAIHPANGRYAPMPFAVTAEVYNTGVGVRDSVFAEIILPPEFRLYGLDAPDRYVKLVQPTRIVAGGSGSAQWVVWHPNTNVLRNAEIAVRLFGSGIDTTSCRELITIPPLALPAIVPQCEVPSALAYVSPATYSPNPFTVRVTAVNEAIYRAKEVTATLKLPPFVVPVDANDPMTKRLTPDVLLKYVNGSPKPFAEWALNYVGRTSSEEILRFEWEITGKDSLGYELEPITVICETKVPPSEQAFSCSIQGPDSLSVRQDRGGLVPNPVRFTAVIRNVSSNTIIIAEGRASFTGAGGLWDPSTPSLQTVGAQLLPGDSISITWLVHVNGQPVSQILDFAATIVDAFGNRSDCSKNLFVPGTDETLTCLLGGTADTILVDPSSQTVVPAQWVIAATVANTSLREARNVRLRLEWSGDNGTVALDGAVAGNTAARVIPSLGTRQTLPVTWSFIIADPAKLPLGTIAYRLVYADSLSPEERVGCEIQQLVRDATNGGAGFVCRLKAVDTVRFIDTGYVPARFFASLEVLNGTMERANGVWAYLLQSTRFTAQSSPALTLGDIMPGVTVGTGGTLGFDVLVNPRSDDGYDTLFVLITAENGRTTRCYFPVFVEGEQVPVLDLQCALSADTVVYSRSTNRHTPPALDLQVTATNRGDASASSVVFYAPSISGFQLLGDSSFSNKAALGPLESVSHLWQYSPLPSNQGFADTVEASVEYSGGAGRRVFRALCSDTIVYVLTDGPNLDLSCSFPPEVRYNTARREFQPSVLQCFAVVRNNDPTLQTNLQVELRLPPGVVPMPGEQLTKVIPPLAGGDSIEITWLLQPLIWSGEAKFDFCVVLLDGGAQAASCCKEIPIILGATSSLSVACSAPDSLHINFLDDGYLDSPFDVCVEIVNTSDKTVKSFSAAIDAFSPSLMVLGPKTISVTDSLAPGASYTVCWRVDVTPMETALHHPIIVRVMDDAGVPAECFQTVFAPGVSPSMLRCHAIVLSGDTVRNDGGASQVFVSLRLVNAAGKPLHDIWGRITLPAGAQLDSSESLLKPLLPPVLPPGGNAEAIWSLTIPAMTHDADMVFTVEALESDSVIITCSSFVHVVPAPRRMYLRIPSDGLMNEVQSVIMPVLIDSLDAGNIETIRLLIGYDSEYLTVEDVKAPQSEAGTLRADPSWSIVSPEGKASERIIRIEDVLKDEFTPAAGDVLYNLRFTVSPYLRDDGLWTVQTPLPFFDTLSIGGDMVLSSVNAATDSTAGAVRLLLSAGLMTISSECIVPLTFASSGAPRLHQNRPNPFNPATTISFVLPDAGQTLLRVFDVYGREVGRLADGALKQGTHTVTFEGRALPAGVYYYTLEFQGKALTRTMVLTK